MSDDATRLPAIVRPDGRVYQPREIRTAPWENDEDDCGVVVLGTHDLERAQALADQASRCWYDRVAMSPVADWYRLGIQGGDPQWRVDRVRGAAGIWFTARVESDDV